MSAMMNADLSHDFASFRQNISVSGREPGECTCASDDCEHVFDELSSTRRNALGLTPSTGRFYGAVRSPDNLIAS